VMIRDVFDMNGVTLGNSGVAVTVMNKNSSGDEIANVNFFTTSHMYRPAPTPIERVRNFY